VSTGAAGDGRDASVVVVVGPGDRDPATTVDAALRSPGVAEVIVVANGRAAAGLDRPGARLVRLAEPVPFGTAADRGASFATGRALCFVAAGAGLPTGWLAPLLEAVAADGVGCAVPRVAPSADAAARPAPAEQALPRRTQAGSAACLCVRRSGFTAAGGFEPAVRGLLAAGAELCGRLADAGLSCRYEPASCVVDDTATSGSEAGPDEATPGDAVLVVTRAVPSADGAYAERRAAQLVCDLSVLVPDGGVTVVALDGRRAGQDAPALLRRGVEVVTAPEDWDAWLARRALRYSHVVVTDLAGHRRLEASLRSTQPQAQRILALPSLDFEDVASAGPPAIAGAEAAEAAETAEERDVVAEALRGQLARMAREADAAWCATSRDRRWLVGTAPHLRSAVVRSAAAGAAGHLRFEERAGYVVLASPGADVVAGHEDAARFAATHILPELVARHPAAVLRIVTDEPSPALQLLAGPNVELVPASPDPARWFRRSRVCLAYYPRGAGSREAVALALDTATPLVTSSAARRDQDLGGVTGIVVGDDPPSLALAAEEMHRLAPRWRDAHEALARLAAGPRSPADARLRLLRAAADAGIAPRAGTPLAEPVGAAGRADERPLRPRRVPIAGSAWSGAPPAEDGSVPELPAPGHQSDWTAVPVDDQYRRWCARYGPTSKRLGRLAERLDGLVRRPTISVVMPVFETDPSWLDDAIASVRSQVYEHWELCIGDDGTTRAATLAVLERHAAEDPRVRVTRLPGRQGIAAASNAALSLATGEFVGLLDHDDELKPHALGEIALALDDRPTLDLIYTDEDKREPDGRLVDPFFKPDWSPDHLMSRNYVCHFLVLRRRLLEKLGGFRAGYDGSQDYDLVLRAVEATTEIAHLAEPLYTWRKVSGSTAAVADAKPWALDAARRALADAVERRGTPGEVVDGLLPTTYRVRYALRGRPKVSIIIPTRDRVDHLRGCVESVLERSTYTNFELLAVDNQSADPETLGYLAAFPGRVLRYPLPFNYSRLMNLAASHAAGDLLVFLNNDTKVRTPDWLESLAEHAQRPEVGIVAPRLLYPNGHPQHEGTIVGYKGGHAGNVDHRGFWGMGDIVRNCSAVTGACLMMRPSVFWELGGLDERLRVAFNDVDLCLRARQAGYDVVYTPYAELFHVEGGTRGIHAHVDDDDEFEAHWVTHKCLDPFYNPNFERLYPFRIRG